MPAFNAARFIRAALASVFAQTYRPLEVVVVDDGSRDDTAAVAEAAAAGDTPFHLIRQTNQGISAARNAGIARATGEFLAFVDSDDLITPDRLARQVAAAADHPDATLFFGHMMNFRNADWPPERPGLPPAPEVMPGKIPGTLLVRRADFLRIGPFDPAISVGEFVDWYARARAAGLTEWVLPDLVLFRRIHDDNIGIRTRADRSSYLHLLKKKLDRERAQARPSATGSAPTP